MQSKILIIAHQFYPINAGGSHRPFRMSKYLKANGIEPIVISVDDPTQQGHDASLDELLLNSNIRVIKTSIKPENWYSKISESYYFNIVDDIYARWQSSLIPAIDQLINEENISNVLITAPPFSMTQLVSGLKQLHPQVKVILDMRDAWANWNVAPYASRFHYFRTLKAEYKAFNSADHILATSQITIDDFKTDHPNIDDDKFGYIPNSFDQYQETLESKSKNEKLKIGYVGSFYYEPSRDFLLNAPWYKKKPHQWLQYVPNKEEWKYRSPYFLFKSLSRLFVQFPEYKEKIDITLVGSKPNWLDQMISDFDLVENVTHLGILNKKEVADFEKSMDYLLVTSAKKKGKKDCSIAGKTFEYISLKKTILALVTESAQKDLLESTGLAVIIDPDQTDLAINILKNLIDGKIDTNFDKKICDQYLTENVMSSLKKLL